MSEFVYYAVVIVGAATIAWSAIKAISRLDGEDE